ncbi:hypothetical protein IFM89_035688 [Coptis chinensis]|uniref:Uncharacterized protein n=1 Tax=Coptis chinensis TaxID=261450 RepID=A0A835M7W3_9MAGN|nr:hypothetical protein IFM89_035688 [Coptis chinensis]
MLIPDENGTTVKLEEGLLSLIRTFFCTGLHFAYMLMGKNTAMIVCWLLGNGSLLAWNSMLTAQDYYLSLYPVNDPIFLFIPYS